MKKNKRAVKLLNEKKINNADYIVSHLIEGGFIEEDVMTEPERIAQAARDWLGATGEKSPSQVFNYASGWGTASWEYVLKETCENAPSKNQNIFWALVILAKEAGEEL